MGRRKVSRLEKSIRKMKRSIRRMKLLKPVYKNRKHVAHVLKSMGQVLEKRL